MSSTYIEWIKKFDSSFDLSLKINRTFKELMEIIFKEKR